MSRHTNSRRPYRVVSCLLMAFVAIGGSRRSPRAESARPDTLSVRGAQLLDSPQLAGSEKDDIRFAIRVRSLVGDDVWPGFGKAMIPILVYNDAHDFLVGSGKPPSGWEPVTGDDFDGQPYFRRPTAKPGSFTVQVGGEWVTSMSCRQLMNRDARIPAFLKINVDQYAVFVLHEAFHAFEARSSGRRFERAMATYTTEKTYPYADAAFRDAWNQEGAALAAALQAADRGATTEATARFLAFRDARRGAAGFTPAMLAFERELEWLEGLAKYAEVRCYELAAKRAELSEGNRFRTSPFYFSDVMNLRSRLGEQPNDLRFYLSGNAQARLLDRLAEGWKTGTLSEDVVLEDLLRKAVTGRLGRSRDR